MDGVAQPYEFISYDEVALVGEGAGGSKAEQEVRPTPRTLRMSTHRVLMRGSRAHVVAHVHSLCLGVRAPLGSAQQLPFSGIRLAPHPRAVLCRIDVCVWEGGEGKIPPPNSNPGSVCIIIYKLSTIYVSDSS